MYTCSSDMDTLWERFQLKEQQHRLIQSIPLGPSSDIRQSRSTGKFGGGKEATLLMLVSRQGISLSVCMFGVIVA